MTVPKIEKIQDYAIIGNGRSAALVSRNGSIDWLCWPRFDSPSIFGKILDLQIGGFWNISPNLTTKIERHYIKETNVLQTNFYTSTGKLILTDFMTALSEKDKTLELHPEHELIRQLHCEEGEIEVEIHYNPAPNYAQEKISIIDAGTLGLRIEIGQHLICLHTPIKFDSIGIGGARTLIKLKKGEKLNFSLTYSTEGPAVIPPLSEHLIFHKYSKTVEWWQTWAKRAQYKGPYRDIVIRSLLVLKLLGYAPSGAFIAAPTTSLPERQKGDSNWDYRFCWLRDASLTVRSLLALGYSEEAEAFINWMLHSTRLTLPELKAAYDVYGERMKDEMILSHLEGYNGSRPVRIGNVVYDQIQLDIYGEVIDGVNYFVQHGGILDNSMKEMLRRIGTYVCKNWQKKDSGIWEERTALENYTYSRLMCWVALDKLLRMKDVCFLSEKNIEEFNENRQQIRIKIEEEGWNSELKAYTSTLNGKKLDACMLLMPYYEFENASSLRLQETFKKIKEKLDAGPGLIYRNENSINYEGAFLPCSFWKVDFIARGGGSLQEAHKTFNETLLYANDLGLFAEESDPITGDALGNFPQAFTHLGLINAALLLMEKKDNELE